MPISPEELTSLHLQALQSSADRAEGHRNHLLQLTVGLVTTMIQANRTMAHPSYGEGNKNFDRFEFVEAAIRAVYKTLSEVSA